MDKPQPAQQPTSKFEDAILHWTAKKMPASFHEDVRKTLNGISGVVVQQDGDSTLIQVESKRIKLGANRSAGSITLGYGDWMAGLILIRLASFLSIDVVNESSNSVDRRSLKALFVEQGYEFVDEFEDYAVNLGLIPKLDDSVRAAVTQFF